MAFKILILGAGGREHALLRAVQRSQNVEEIYVLPGSDAMSEIATCVNIDIADHAAIIEFAKEKSVDLTLVGPEAPLVDGVGSAFRKAGLKILGPSREASQLEGSKVFTKDFLKKYKIPTAEYAVFSDYDLAVQFLESRQDKLWVIKADGLAAGKGVLMCANHDEAVAAVKQVLVDQTFGSSGSQVVIEEFLDGEEVSFMVLCDGKTALPLATSQDHKRLKDNDEGPNTGGMGAYSPAPLVTPELHARIMQEIIEPTMQGMQSEAMPYQGILYAGLMIVRGEPIVLEYNIRFGDPEAQVILPRLESDFVQVALAAVDGSLDRCHLSWSSQVAAGVVLAAPGYPEKPQKGLLISGLDLVNEKSTYVYHAGTQKTAEGFITSGGRVLTVSSLGDNLSQALEKVYAAVDQIDFEGKQFRKDIGKRAL